METNLCRIIYRSTAVKKIEWDTVKALIKTSQKNNMVDGITGMVLSTDFYFFQIMEGDALWLNRTFQRICKDNRHRELIILDYSEIPYREFGDWSMKGVGFEKLSSEVRTQLQQSLGTDADGNLLLPETTEKALYLLKLLKKWSL